MFACLLGVSPPVNTPPAHHPQTCAYREPQYVPVRVRRVGGRWRAWALPLLASSPRVGRLAGRVVTGDHPGVVDGPSVQPGVPLSAVVGLGPDRGSGLVPFGRGLRPVTVRLVLVVDGREVVVTVIVPASHVVHRV